LFDRGLKRERMLCLDFEVELLPAQEDTIRAMLSLPDRMRRPVPRLIIGSTVKIMPGIDPQTLSE